MQPPDSIVVTDRLRSAIADLASRLGTAAVTIEPGWQEFGAAACRDVDSTSSLPDGGHTIIVGSPDLVVEFATSSQVDEFGFVTVVAETTRWWQRAPSWRTDATMDLWHAGWSPVRVDRIEVAGHEATIEFAIGIARPTTR